MERIMDRITIREKLKNSEFFHYQARENKIFCCSSISLSHVTFSGIIFEFSITEKPRRIKRAKNPPNLYLRWKKDTSFIPHFLAREVNLRSTLNRIGRNENLTVWGR